MGVNLKDLVVKKEIQFSHLSGKVLAVDAFNTLYQFLTTIRSPDGSVFTDSSGRVTSHLIGLFHRTTKLMEFGMKLVFVFDGEAPLLKKKTREMRADAKKEAVAKFEEAQQAGDIVGMRKFAGRTSVLTSEMIAESKELLRLLGVPVVQAPSEGEAQAAFMTQKGDAYAAVSQDFDSLLSGSVRLVRNLSIEGKKKQAGKLAYSIVQPEMLVLDDVLASLGVTREQLVVIGILVGTDYAPGGVTGIGPKKALKLVKEEKNFDVIFKKLEWKTYFDFAWTDVYDTIMKMPVTSDYELSWRSADADKIRAMLVEGHSFSADRVEQRLKKLIGENEKKKQTGLGGWMPSKSL